jgi:HAD superfamily hydrolase (TIGR01509 family)
MIRGIAFDLDGVLADTERLHFAAYREVLLELGVDIGIEEYRVRFIARGGGPAWACEKYDLPFGPDELRDRKMPIYLALLREKVSACPGAREALERMHRTHRVAVATNATRAEVTVVFGRLGFGPFVHAVVSREDYARAKPEPDAYLAAAAALGLPPADCVAVEDTERGLGAARAAGLPVIAVPNDLTFDNDFTGASRKLSSLDELTENVLADLG